jgi:hypothetical protein
LGSFKQQPLPRGSGSTNWSHCPRTQADPAFTAYNVVFPTQATQLATRSIMRPNLRPWHPLSQTLKPSNSQTLRLSDAAAGEIIDAHHQLFPTLFETSASLSSRNNIKLDPLRRNHFHASYGPDHRVRYTPLVLPNLPRYGVLLST